MIRVEMEVSVPSLPAERAEGVLGVAETVASSLRHSITEGGGVVHRLLVEEDDA